MKREEEEEEEEWVETEQQTEEEKKTTKKRTEEGTKLNRGMNNEGQGKSRGREQLNAGRRTAVAMGYEGRSVTYKEVADDKAPINRTTTDGRVKMCRQETKTNRP
jgi:hypothetical protein